MFNRLLDIGSKSVLAGKLEPGDVVVQGDQKRGFTLLRVTRKGPDGRPYLGVYTGPISPSSPARRASGFVAGVVKALDWLGRPVSDGCPGGRSRGS